MRPVIIRCPLIPAKFCVNIFGTLWVRDPSWIDRYMINHELIHTAQMRELLYLPFYIIYLLEWLCRLVQHRNWYDAYKSISFEREAYSHCSDLDYLSTRPHFAQWRHSKQ